jgi:peptidoglycan/xylan/chitin deacetylase (PgdA/CDA1 family)
LIVHLPGGIRVSRSLRQWRSRIRPGVAILGYHRVSDAKPDALGLSVSPAHFRAQLAVIARLAAPLRLAVAARELASGRVPPRGLVLTFDDGYADNLYTLLPLLEEHEIPATIFVTSGNRGGEFWWDRLARAMAGTAAAADTYRVAAELERLPEQEREHRLRRLEAENARLPQIVYRSLTAAELQRLAASPLIEIGAHSESHAPLTRLPSAAQRDETLRSRRELERLLGGPVTSFAYPHGAMSPETVAIVRESGYSVACCSKADVATARSPLLALPRLWVRNLDGDRFERWLRGWLHA